MINELFTQWITADGVAYEIKQKIKKLDHELVLAETQASEVMVQVKDYMNHNGLVEDLIHGELLDYKIHFTSARESVKIENPDSVPDDFCKLDRKPELKKIKAFIDEGNQVNWATVETGTPKLTYKAITRR